MFFSLTQKRIYIMVDDMDRIIDEKYIRAWEKRIGGLTLVG